MHPNMYDVVPYPELAHPLTHINHMAAVATLYGIAVAPPNQCRVLEIGCAAGSNIIPMSCHFPQSEFIGVDSSGEHIARGHALLRHINKHTSRTLQLRHMNLCDIDESFGTFDYIIAHGVYSWVPAAIQTALLTVCQQRLAPHGIAYISYNVYPGWHMLGMLRDMMRYHTTHITNPHEQVAHATTFLHMLSGAIPAEYHAYRTFLQQYLDFLTGKIAAADDSGHALLLHDELAPHNTPCYVHEFVRHAAQHGLQYVTDADVPSVMLTNLPTTSAYRVQTMASTMAASATAATSATASYRDIEQYMDFVCGRTFRETLLCHEHVPVQRTLHPERIATLAVAAHMRVITPEPVLHDSSLLRLQSLTDDSAVEIDHPLSKAACMVAIEACPHALPVTHLVERARHRLHASHNGITISIGTIATDEHITRSTLLNLYTHNMHMLRLYAVAPAIGHSDTTTHPHVSPLVRYHAQQQKRTVTNLLHQQVALSPVQRALTRYLTGTYPVSLLVDLLIECEEETQQEEEAYQKQRTNNMPEEDVPPTHADAYDRLAYHTRWLETHALLCPPL